MSQRLPTVMLQGALAAANGAAQGQKRAAYLQHLQGRIGANYLRQLWRDGVMVWQATASGTLPIVGANFVLPQSATQTAISAAAVSTGTWVHYIRNATDSARFIATPLSGPSGGAPAVLSGDLVGGGTVTLGAFVIQAPALDSASLSAISVSNITTGGATLSVEFSGAAPAGSLILMQTTSAPNTGPWLESPLAAASPGVFSWEARGLVAGAVYTHRAFLFSEPGGGLPTVIYAQTPNLTFTTSASGGGGSVGSELTLADAYATCMTSLNDFPPGNSAGNPDWINSIWDYSNHFQASPYGSNIDPLRFGQSEPGVGLTDANYIVTRSSSAGRNANAMMLWPWLMPPKGALQAPGNWRVQLRDLQAAVKVDSLSNPWTLVYGPGQVPSYGLNNLGGLRISGNFVDYTGATGGPTFLMDTNPLEGRIEASGGISFRSVGKSLAECLVELNAPDPGQALPASATPARTVAFAAVYWARLITDTGSGSVPAGLQVGAMLGVDFYDGGGRLGTPGQSRLVQLGTTWKPIVCAFVLTGLPPAVPQTPAVTGAWLAANPPPFV